MGFKAFIILFCVLMILPTAIKAFMSAKLKKEDPVAWAAQQVADAQVKAAQDARKAQAVSIGWKAFQAYRGS